MLLSSLTDFVAIVYTMRWEVRKAVFAEKLLANPQPEYTKRFVQVWPRSRRIEPRCTNLLITKWTVRLFGFTAWNRPKGPSEWDPMLAR